MAKPDRVLITGSSGLIGSEAVVFFDRLGYEVIGIDAHLRADFFGSEADTRGNQVWLRHQSPRYKPVALDVRDREGIERLVRDARPDIVIHAAAQPSHDLSAKRPFDDFDINATGTLNLLEACRLHSPDAVFILASTNKVYGDGPNRIKMKELETSWDYDDPEYENGISENFPIDNCLHSIFGASKLAADVMAQEYGRYFGLKTGIFRAGCVTGPRHAGVELHGFLNYLVKAAVAARPYQVYGYKGKQVRDQIYSYDVVNAFWHFAQRPKSGAVYNLGGGKSNAASLIECVEMIEQVCGKRPALVYHDEPRKGDHICYFSDTCKLRSHFPEWNISWKLRDIVDELVKQVEKRRVS